ncbi:MAG: DUF455 family protein [Myxococcota bacterium]
MTDYQNSVHAFCLRILESGDLSVKLEAPNASVRGALEDAGTVSAIAIDRPARSEGLELASGSKPLPRPGSLSAPLARAECLARFAHHELMAVELFAWALLRWPQMPAAMRAGLVGVLAQEQVHCALYVERLAEHGYALSDFALSDYFWKHTPVIVASPHGPSAFLCAMGLTLEQANLDFTLVYRDGFREAGDESSAEVCQLIHDEEIEHVRLAAHWLRELQPDAPSDIERYRRAVPFPLSAARAKGRRFDRAGRRKAGLSDDFIEYVRTARSSQEQPGELER